MDERGTKPNHCHYVSTWTNFALRVAYLTHSERVNVDKFNKTVGSQLVLCCVYGSDVILSFSSQRFHERPQQD